MGLVSVLMLLALSASTRGEAQHGARAGEWRSYGGDLGSTKYSPLADIGHANVRALQVAWEWNSPDNLITAENPTKYLSAGFESTPLAVGEILYVSTSLSLAAAIDGRSGKTLWVHDPKSYESGRPPNSGFKHRGVAYWTDGKEERILFGTGDAHLIALDARNGQLVPGFGRGGRVDLTLGLRRPVNRRYYAVTSPPIVVRDVVIVGSVVKDDPGRKTMPPGDVRGFDVRTGELRWTFHTVPQPGEVGNETWLEGSWQYSGNNNVWAPMSADEELGIVYLPVSSPTNDWYGGERLGDNLFGDSLVAVRAETGERVWHFQTIHHGLWDWDLPAAPNLVDLMIDGRPIKAVALLTKQGFTFVFDRETGKPIWPIEERPVPPSTVPGEVASPTQPFPTKPPPFDRQGLTEDDLIDFTPELEQAALEQLRRYDHGPLFTPPSERGAYILPSFGGGANWTGGAVDPETGILYVPSITLVVVASLRRPDPARSDFAFVHSVMGESGEADEIDSAPLGFNVGLRGLPLVKPPYGRVTAIDLQRGEIRWQVPHGIGPRDHPLLRDLDLPPLGTSGWAAPLLTKTLLFVGAATRGSQPGAGDEQDDKLVVYDKASGDVVWTIPVRGGVRGAPMTYLAGGRQYIVFSAGIAPSARLVALGLPGTKAAPH